MKDKGFRTVVVRGIPDAVHKVLRIKAAEKDISVNALIVSVLTDEAQSYEHFEASATAEPIKLADKTGPTAPLPRRHFFNEN